MRLTDRPGRDVPICIAIAALLALVFWPVSACAKCVSLPSACLSNLRQQAIGEIMYADDHDGRFTPRDVWIDGIVPYIKSEPIFHDPELAKGAYGYAFNGALSTSKPPDRPESVPMVYDSMNPIRNASDLVTSLPHPGRHKGRNMIAYAGGHAKAVRVP